MSSDFYAANDQSSVPRAIRKMAAAPEDSSVSITTMNYSSCDTCGDDIETEVNVYNASGGFYWNKMYASVGDLLAEMLSVDV